MDLQIIRDLLRMLMRRFFVFGIVALLGTVASVLYALSLDRVYEASAVVQIRGPQIDADTSGAGAAGSTAQRIQQIEQQLLSRDSLFEVADKYDLFRDAEMSAADRVNLMRQSVRLESIAGVQQGYGQPPEPSALIITLRLADAEKTALVANEFVTRLLERNLRARERQTAETLAFFRREETRLTRQISDLDDLIVEYKSENSGSLPEGLEFRRDELARLAEDHRDITRQRMALERESAMLEQIGSGLPGTGTLAATDPVTAELRRLQIELARRKAASPNHPEIPQLELQIAALSSDESETRRITTQRQRQLIGDEVKLLETQLGTIAERQADLIASIQASPAVELGLSRHMRDRELLQQQLAAAIGGRSEAEVTQRLEASRQSEQFEVLESALVPEYPVEPSRKKIVLAGTVASIGLAAGLVFLLDFLRPVIRSGSQFQRQFGKAPTIVLPYISTVWERRRRRLAMATALLLVVAGLPVSLFLIDRHVMSFEEMAEAVDNLPLPTL